VDVITAETMRIGGRGKYMYKNIKYILIILVFFTLEGCYTMLWTPGTKYQREVSYGESSWYVTDYYGPWAPYYSSPWWELYTARDTYNQNKRDLQTETIRNTDGTRTEPPRRETGGVLLQGTTPPSVDTNQGNNNNSNNNNSNSTNSNSGTRERKSDDKGSLRNNDGNRSTENNRR